MPAFETATGEGPCRTEMSVDELHIRTYFDFDPEQTKKENGVNHLKNHPPEGIPTKDFILQNNNNIEKDDIDAGLGVSRGHNHDEEHGHGHSHGRHSHSHDGGHGHSHGDDDDGENEADDLEHWHNHGMRGQALKKSRRSERVLWMVAALSAVFIAAEFAGGFFAASLAIMTDAGHMLSDLLSFIISIVAIRTARQPASKRLSFGYDRAEILGAMISIIILWILTTILVLLAIERIVNKHYDIDADMMLITACCGVAFNIIMGVVLHYGSAGHGHTHGVGGGHGHSHGGAGGGGNVNVRAALIHVIGDLIQSIGVLISALVIKFTGWGLADPICTFFFSIIVLFTTITVLRDIFFVLMEATPRHLDFLAVKDDLAALDGVLGVHDLRLWSLNMDKTALAVHLAIANNSRALQTVNEARELVQGKYGISTATVQVESYDKSMSSCEQCLQSA